MAVLAGGLALGAQLKKVGSEKGALSRSLVKLFEAPLRDLRWMKALGIAAAAAETRMETSERRSRAAAAAVEGAIASLFTYCYP